LTAAIQSKSEDVDAWTRAFAEEQASRAGVPVREWLERFVVDQTGGMGGAPLDSDHDEAVKPHAETGDDAVTLAVDVSQETEAAPSSQSDERAAALLPGDDIERVFERQLAQLDEAAADEPAETSDDSATRLGDIESALQQIAAEQGPDIVAGGHAEADAPTREPPELPRSSIGAIEGLSLEFARLAEVVDCGLERIEAITAREVAELRGEVAQLFDGLAARVDTVERRSIGPLDAGPHDDLLEPATTPIEAAFRTTIEPPPHEAVAEEAPGGADDDHAEEVFAPHAAPADQTHAEATDLELGDETWDSLFEPTPDTGAPAEQQPASRGKGAFFPSLFGQTKRLLRSA
jgi:hypothetical protein